MIDAARDWWQGLTRREHILLSILGVLLVAMAGYLALWRPVNLYLESGRVAQAAALDRLAMTQAMVAEIRRAPATPASEAINVGALINQSAIEAGFTLSKNEPKQDGEVAVVINSVKGRGLMSWLAMLERKGIFVRTASVRTNGDGTITFDAVLRGRSA